MQCKNCGYNCDVPAYGDPLCSGCLDLIAIQHQKSLLNRVAPQATVEPLPVAAEKQDKAILDWLENKCVNVRQNLLYGSKDMFWSAPENMDGGPDGPSDLRKRCIASMQGEKA